MRVQKFRNQSAYSKSYKKMLCRDAAKEKVPWFCSNPWDEAAKSLRLERMSSPDGELKGRPEDNALKRQEKWIQSISQGAVYCQLQSSTSHCPCLEVRATPLHFSSAEDKHGRGEMWGLFHHNRYPPFSDLQSPEPQNTFFCTICFAFPFVCDKIISVCAYGAIFWCSNHEYTTENVTVHLSEPESFLFLTGWLGWLFVSSCLNEPSHTGCDYCMYCTVWAMYESTTALCIKHILMHKVSCTFSHLITCSWVLRQPTVMFVF